MPYLWNEVEDGTVRSTPVYVTVWVYNNEDDDEWDEEHRLTVAMDGRIESSQELNHDYSLTVEDWDGNRTDIESGWSWNDVFTVLYTRAAVNEAINTRLGGLSNDPLVGLLKEVVTKP